MSETFKNVLLITVDSLRADRINVYGHKIDTLNFKELTRHGYLFLNASANSPGTPSSFPAILTSTYPMMYGGYGKITETRPYLPQYLKNTLGSNIVTIGVNSNAFLSRYFGYSSGFDLFFDNFQYSKFTKLVFYIFNFKIKPLFGYPPYIHWKMLNNKYLKPAILRATSRGKTFFAWIHYMDVHVPYMYNSRVKNIINKYKLKIINDTIIRVSRGESGKVSENLIYEIKSLYDEGVNRVDHAIGDILDFIEKHDILDDTLIIVTSDHGEEFIEHGGLCHMPKLYEELLRIPLVISNPNLPKKKIEVLVDQLDIAPTIADAFGVSSHSKWLGRSILDVHQLKDKLIISEVANSTISAKVNRSLWKIAVKNKRWKLHYQVSFGILELYDLVRDPQELKDVSEKQPDVVKELVKTINDHIRAVYRTNFNHKLTRTIENLKLKGKI